MKIIEVKASIKIDNEGNHTLGTVDSTKDFLEIESTTDESTGTILSWTNKVKEFNDKEINLTKKIIGLNTSGYITYRLLIN